MPNPTSRAIADAIVADAIVAELPAPGLPVATAALRARISPRLGISPDQFISAVCLAAASGCLARLDGGAMLVRARPEDRRVI